MPGVEPNVTNTLQTLISTLQNVVVGLGNITQQFANIFVQVTGTASTATAGSGGSLPATVQGYVIVNIPGVGLSKIPYYKV